MSTTSRLFAVLAPTLLAAAGAALIPAPAQADSCPDVQVVFARGTWEPAGVGRMGQAFADSLTARLPGKSVDVYGVDYPASLNFGAAADGVADASAKVMNTAAQCPNTKIVLGGYSQGAAVAAYVTEDAVPQGFDLPANIQGPMPPSIASHVAAVALFGKPSSGFMQMVYSAAPPIDVGSQYAAKTVEECIPGDPVCSPNGWNRGAHGAYADQGLTDQAAAFVADKLPRGWVSAPVNLAAASAPAAAPIDPAAAPVAPAAAPLDATVAPVDPAAAQG